MPDCTRGDTEATIPLQASPVAVARPPRAGRPRRRVGIDAVEIGAGAIENVTRGRRRTDLSAGPALPVIANPTRARPTRPLIKPIATPAGGAEPGAILTWRRV